MTYKAEYSEDEKQECRDLIGGLDPVFVTLLKRRTAMGGLVADLTRESSGQTVVVSFPAATVSRLSHTVNVSPQGVLDPRFIGEVSGTIKGCFDLADDLSRL
mgnify:CR=1 FL=1